MPNLSSLSHFPLKVIFAIHLILVTWSLQGHWCPKSALFYNLLFFLCLLWAIQNIESDEPIQFALFINVLSIFLDVITLAVYFPPAYEAERFSVAVMIINMLARCITSIYLLRIGSARGGSLAALFATTPTMDLAEMIPLFLRLHITFYLLHYLSINSIWLPFSSFGRQDYEDISHPIPQNSDFDGV